MTTINIDQGALGANPTATAGPIAVNGVAATFMRSDAAPAVQKASSSQFGIVEVDGTTITASSGIISSVSAAGANPTATASDVAVNGSAGTFMRSDAAPAVQKTSASVFGLCKVDNTTITASSGVISAVASGTGNVSGPGTSTDRAIVTWNGTSGVTLRDNSATAIDASGNISTTGKFTATGNVTGGNLTTGGLISATGNVTGGNLTTGGIVTATGNVSGGNLTTAGLVSATGTVSGSNIGNITPVNLDGNGTHVLLGNGTFGVSPSGGGGAMTLIATNTPSSGNTTSFTSIPGTFTHLLLTGYGRGDASASSIQVNLTFNSDTSSNYDTQGAETGTGVSEVSSVASGSTAKALVITAATAPTGRAGGGSCLILNYANTTYNKIVKYESAVFAGNTTTTMNTEVGFSNWRNTAAITRIDAKCSSGNFTSGCSFSLYGIS